MEAGLETGMGEQKTEILRGQHFDYVLVFGQGPVQEQEKIPASGREGLNFFSRVVALSAASMLRDGITDRLILSGGQTGARQGTPEAQTEADLMADIIRRKLTVFSADGQAYTANGLTIPTYDNKGNKREQKQIDEDIKSAWQDKILIENQATDTLQNFTFVLNKYIDAAGSLSKPTMALLGIGFHAQDTHNGTGEGRLKAMAEIFQIPGKVYAAEDVLLELEADKRSDKSGVRKRLESLMELARNNEVSKLKSQQEKLLIQYLRQGDWASILPFIQNHERARSMIINDFYVRSELLKQRGLSERDISEMDYQRLLEEVAKTHLTGLEREGYRQAKQAVFDRLKALGDDYFSKYAKGEIPL